MPLLPFFRICAIFRTWEIKRKREKNGVGEEEEIRRKDSARGNAQSNPLLFILLVVNYQAPSTRIRIFSNPQLFLSGYGYRPHVSGEFDSESGKK